MRRYKRVGIYRSSFEAQLAEQIAQAGLPIQYESQKLHYEFPAVRKIYRPDFILPNGILIEAKGLFTAADRKKLLAVRECNPGIDLRIVLQYPNTLLRKGSPTRYADWCDKNGFLWAAKWIPEEWLA